MAFQKIEQRVVGNTSFMAFAATFKSECLFEWVDRIKRGVCNIQLLAGGWNSLPDFEHPPGGA